MSGFEALSLVAMVFQTISFAHELVKSFYELYNGKPTGFDTVQQNLTSMTGASVALRKHLETLQTSRAGKEDASLIELLERTEQATSQLKDQIDYVLAKRQAGSFRGTATTQVRYWRKKEDIKDTTATLRDCQITAQTLLQSRNVEVGDMARLEQSVGFSALSSDVKEALKQLSTGQSQIVDKMQDQIEKLEKLVEQIPTEAQAKQILDRELSRKQEQDLLAQQRQQLLESLSYPEMYHRGNQILDPDEASFGPEFFRDTEDEPEGWSSEDDFESESGDGHIATKEIQKFREWIAGGSRLFWISGLAGSGKSTLLRFLVHSEAAHYGSKAEFLSHYFWKAGTSMQTSARGMLLSVLHQMLAHSEDRVRQVLASVALKASNKTVATAWSDSSLMEMFQLLTRDLPSNTVLFIDGLDEMDNDDEMYKVLDMVTGQDSTRLRFCVASRPEWIIRQELSQHPTIEVQRITRYSMEMYSQRKLSSFLDKASWDVGEQRALCEELSFKAEGVFLWLVLSVRIIRRMIVQRQDRDTIYERLRAMPSQLDDLFTDMWGRVGSDFPLSQKLTAGYLSAAVMMQRIESEFPHSYAAPASPPPHLKTLCLLLTYNQEDLEVFAANAEARQGSSVQPLLKWTLDKLDELVIHCMGFLIVKNPPHASVVDFELVTPGLFKPEIVFIHRSVYEYFTITERGQSILSISPISYRDCCLRMAKAAFTTIRVLGFPTMTEPHGCEYAFAALSKAIDSGLDATRCAREVIGLVDQPELAMLDQTIVYLYTLQPYCGRLEQVNSTALLSALLSYRKLSKKQISFLLKSYWFRWLEMRRICVQAQEMSPLNSVEILLAAGAEVNKPTMHGRLYKNGLGLSSDLAHFGTPFTDSLAKCFLMRYNSEPFDMQPGTKLGSESGREALKVFEAFLLRQANFREKISFGLYWGGRFDSVKFTVEQIEILNVPTFAIVVANACWLYLKVLESYSELELETALDTWIRDLADRRMANVVPTVEIAAIATPWVGGKYLMRTDFHNFNASAFVSDVLRFSLSRRFTLSDLPLQHTSDHTWQNVLERILAEEDLTDWTVNENRSSGTGPPLLGKATEEELLAFDHLQVVDLPDLVRETNRLLGRVPRGLVDDLLPPMEEWPLNLHLRLKQQGYKMAARTRSQSLHPYLCQCRHYYHLPHHYQKCPWDHHGDRRDRD